MQNRCGAKGIVVQRNGVVGIEVTSLISEVVIRHLHISLSEDLSVGMFVTMKNLFEEHQGLVIVSEQGVVIDEGEIWPITSDAPDLKFVSDWDGGPFDDFPVEDLVGWKVEIKPEIFDELGAYQRLREIKSLLSK